MNEYEIMNRCIERGDYDGARESCHRLYKRLYEMNQNLCRSVKQLRSLRIGSRKIAGVRFGANTASMELIKLLILSELIKSQQNPEEEK